MYLKNVTAGKRISIMQPYFFPYIGYFQLLAHSDLFVVYDDVNFIKQGWVNRNRIMINRESKYLTIPCRNISSNIQIRYTNHALTEQIISKLLKKVRLAYQSAPFFDEVYSIIESVLNAQPSSISELASQSLQATCRYLQIDIPFKFSSKSYDNEELNRSDRLIDICRSEDAGYYLNNIGGRELYDGGYFAVRGIRLQLLDPVIKPYQQFDNTFIPGLSIIDVMMFNAPERIMQMVREGHVISKFVHEPATVSYEL